MFCKFCGTENAEDAIVCRDCGKDIKLKQSEFYTEEKDEAREQKLKSFSTASLVLGIVTAAVSVVCCCLVWITTIICIITGVLAIVYGVLSINSVNKAKSIWGIVLGAIGMIISIIITIILIAMTQNGQFDEILKMLEEYQKQNQMTVHLFF